ncbi:MAG: tyrosine-type recombinase/integrase [Patescibacteria group bacterium]|jgi:integrase/recombinase XerD
MLPNFKEFLLYLEKKDYSIQTIHSYERDLNTFENFLEEDIKIGFDQLNKRHIIKFQTYLSSASRQTAAHEQGEKKLSSQSINRMLSSLRSYIKFLIDVNYKSPIDSDSIKLLKIEKEYGQVPEMPDLIRLIECPTKFETDLTIKLRNRAMLETLFSTGMRISELLSLKREQLDNTGRIYVMGKGKKQRFVYLTPRAIKHIKDYLLTRHDQAPYLFIPYRGLNNADKNKKISTNYLQAKIKKYRELLSINIPISAHSIRHSFATYLAENGANPAAIQILLGHESLDTTTRYVHTSDRYAEKMHTDFYPLKK